MSNVLKKAKELLYDRVATIQGHHKNKPLTKEGFEVPDPVPMAPPIGYTPPDSIFDRVREMIRSDELRREALLAGAETFEEGDDFEIGDDYEEQSKYELDNELLSLSELRRREKEERERDEASPPPSPAPTPNPPAAAKGGGGKSGASPNKAPASPPQPDAGD